MLYETVDTTLDRSEQMLRQELFFHTIRLHCQTNHPALLRMLGVLLDRFPRCATPSGEARYSVFCYCDPAQFPVPLPRHRLRLGEMQLLTGTHLKYYRDNDGVREYQSYIVQPQVNAAALSVIDVRQHEALTQLEPLERYEAAFLQRYVLLLALGRLLHPYGFEPCHAAAICAPWDHRQGALIIGSSGSGKTTLVLSCLQIGMQHLADDVLFLARDDELIYTYAFPEDIGVRTGTLDLLGQHEFMQNLVVDQREKLFVDVQQHFRSQVIGHAPIHLLLFVHAKDRDTDFRAEPIAPAQAVSLLVQEYISRQEAQESAVEDIFELFVDLVAQAPAYRLWLTPDARRNAEQVRMLLKPN